MASANNIIQSVKFVESGFTFFVLAVIFNSKWKKYSLHLTRDNSFIEDGVTKQRSNTIFLPITFVPPLIAQLEPTYCFAKQLEESEGEEIFRLVT